MSEDRSRWARLSRELAADGNPAAIRLQTQREPVCTCTHVLTRHSRRSTRCLHPQCDCQQWTPLRPGPASPRDDQ